MRCAVGLDCPGANAATKHERDESPVVKQPLGVKIFGALFLAFGMLGLWFKVTALVHWLRDPKLSSQLILAVCLLLLNLVFNLACGIGLLMLKSWARRLTMLMGGLLASECVLLVVVVVVARLASLPFPHGALLHWLGIPASWLGVFGSIVCWYGVIIGYFLRPSVKAQFTSSGSG